MYQFFFRGMFAMSIVCAPVCAGFMLHFARTRSSYWNEAQSCGDLTRECRNIPLYAVFSGVVTFGVIPALFMVVVFPCTFALLAFVLLGWLAVRTLVRCSVRLQKWAPVP